MSNHPLSTWQKQNGITNTALAEKLGIDPSYITYINKGRRTPSPKLARRIEKETGGQVSRWVLLYPEESQTKSKSQGTNRAA